MYKQKRALNLILSLSLSNFFESRVVPKKKFNFLLFFVSRHIDVIERREVEGVKMKTHTRTKKKK